MSDEWQRNKLCETAGALLQVSHRQQFMRCEPG